MSLKLSSMHSLLCLKLLRHTELGGLTYISCLDQDEELTLVPSVSWPSLSPTLAFKRQFGPRNKLR